MLLSIYIPTYQRISQFCSLASILDHEIDLMIAHFPDNVDLLEVVVSCSHPPDFYALKPNVAKLNNGKFYRFVLPQGPLPGSVNVVCGSSFCGGKYVWTLCDDDVPKRGSLKYLIELLQSFSDPPSLLYLEPDFLFPDSDSGHSHADSSFQAEHVSAAYAGSSISQVDLNMLRSITAEWLSSNVDKLLRASSLVIRRCDTHCYWLSSSRDTQVTPLALALDAFKVRESYIVESRIYFYLESSVNKKSWSPKWPIIRYLEAYPLAIDFLLSSDIYPNPRFFKLTLRESYSLVLSLIKYPIFLFKFRSLRQIVRYIRSALSCL